jgi:tetratricopeptide (TPR) repeat protein
MLTDTEVRSVTEDSLQFEAFAQTLEEIISISKTPITIGVYGTWGSGKTSLMRMTEDLLRNRDNSDNIKIKTVWFDAWKFDKTRDLRVALIHAILRAIEADKDPNLKEKARELIRRVNWFGLGKIALSTLFPAFIAQQGGDPLIKDKEDIPRMTLDLIGDFEDAFEKLVEGYTGRDGRLVVFIDDLDRCISVKAVDILEAIKLFLNVQSTVFVIGADKKRIEEGIIEKFGKKSEDWARNYMEKIVQVPFKLPPLRKYIITNEFIQNLAVSDEIKKYAEILAAIGNNPRVIKRLLNSFELSMILAKKKNLEIDEKVVAKLAVIEFKWPDFYTDLIRRYGETKEKENLAKIIKNISESGEIERENRLKGEELLKKYFGDKGLMEFLEREPLLSNVNLDQYIYLARSTFGEAEERYREAIRMNPNDVDAHYNLGNLLYDLERDDEAEKEYREAIRINPDYAAAHKNLGNLLYDLERDEEAEKEYREAIRINPDYAAAHNNLGILLKKLERDEEAEKEYREAIRINPDYAAAHKNLGILLKKLERDEEAEKEYREAIRINPDYAAAH